MYGFYLWAWWCAYVPLAAPVRHNLVIFCRLTFVGLLLSIAPFVVWKNKKERQSMYQYLYLLVLVAPGIYGHVEKGRSSNLTSVLGQAK
jgi:hypothetical protein